MKGDGECGEIDEKARFVLAVGNALVFTKRLDREDVVRCENAVVMRSDRHHRIFRREPAVIATRTKAMLDFIEVGIECSDRTLGCRCHCIKKR